MFIRAAFVVCLIVAALLAACAGPERKVTPLGQREPPPGPKIEEQPKAPLAPTKPAPVAAPIQAQVELSPRTNWISLHEWCEQNRLPAPRITATGSQTNVEIRSEFGEFILEPPRRNARWNGVLVGVGFPIQFSENQAWINELDVAKVLQPLILSNGASAARTNGGVVVIDPGHGGRNLGALSFDRRMMEKEVTLDWARRIQKLLEGTQWKAILTRDGDFDLALTQRVAIAETHRADLFISLHFNSYSRGDKEAGLETYCITPQGMASHLTRDYLDEIGAAFPNNAFDTENILLAHDMHRSMLKKTERRDRGVRRARFMTVLREQRRPAVLLEGGYLSNPEEARLIASEEFRQKLAEAVVEALGVTPATYTTLRK